MARAARPGRSTYVTGQVDSTGGFAFAEAGGPVRYMKPDGEVITVAGWRVKPGRDPIWLGHPVNVVRQNMELRGTWLNGQYGDSSGFRTPLDVAIDPANERIWYVAGYEDHCIWKIEILDSAFTTSASASLPAVPGTSPGSLTAPARRRSSTGRRRWSSTRSTTCSMSPTRTTTPFAASPADGDVTTLAARPGHGRAAVGSRRQHRRTSTR